MLSGLAIAITLHIVAGAFWAGATIAVAVIGTVNRRLFALQMSAAPVVIIAGGFLWHTLHRGQEGPTEHLLSIGAICALLALAIQAAGAGPAMYARPSTDSRAPRRANRALRSYQIAAILLTVATAAMAASRYA